MKVLVCGGRDYSDRGMVYGVLDGMLHAHGTLVIVQGGAKGADALARKWAAENGCNTITYAATWDKYGKSAGPKRNQAMLDCEKPDVIVAFPGGTGTADMTSRARKAGVRIVQIAEVVTPNGNIPS